MTMSYWLRVLPLLPVSVLALSVTLQSGCSGDEVSSDDDDDDSGLSAGCRESEVERTVDGKTFCCAPGSDKTSCFGSGSKRAGDACDDEGAKANDAVELEVDTDKCISEACTGDAVAEEFNAVTVRTQRDLICVEASDGSKIWTSDGDAKVHVVTRVCTEGETTACGGGYGGGYTGRAATERDVIVFSSKCRTGEGSAVDCPADSL